MLGLFVFFIALGGQVSLAKAQVDEACTLSVEGRSFSVDVVATGTAVEGGWRWNSQANNPASAIVVNGQSVEVTQAARLSLIGTQTGARVGLSLPTHNGLSILDLATDAQAEGKVANLFVFVDGETIEIIRDIGSPHHLLDLRAELVEKIQAGQNLALGVGYDNENYAQIAVTGAGLEFTMNSGRAPGFRKQVDEKGLDCREGVLPNPELDEKLLKIIPSLQMLNSAMQLALNSIVECYPSLTDEEKAKVDETAASLQNISNEIVKLAVASAEDWPPRIDTALRVRRVLFEAIHGGDITEDFYLSDNKGEVDPALAAGREKFLKDYSFPEEREKLQRQFYYANSIYLHNLALMEETALPALEDFAHASRQAEFANLLNVYGPEVMTCTIQLGVTNLRAEEAFDAFKTYVDVMNANRDDMRVYDVRDIPQ
ncbi:MAG: hypothetical protein AAFO72_05150 [Pseudomonadota bacterium]